jgi:hypothetical protein
MFILENEKISVTFSEHGTIASLVNKPLGYNMIARPDLWWKIIFADTHCEENLITSLDQKMTASASPDRLTIAYDRLRWRDQELPIQLCFNFELQDDEIHCTAEVHNQAAVELMEVCFPIIGGIAGLSGNPANDSLAWPRMNGMLIRHPVQADFVALSGFPKYHSIDQIKTEITLLYPGGHTAMPWFDLFNADQGLYLASYDRIMQTICLRVEKSTAHQVLMPGLIAYPCLSSGESWTSGRYIVSAHCGDWHVAADKYRAWSEQTWWTAPDVPQWMQLMKGWLRVIIRHQYGEILWKYADLPALFAEAQRLAGVHTLYLLGWESGGFSKNWPDYEPDEELGGRAGLIQAVEEIHRMGGKVLVYVSYGCIDNQSSYYRRGPGKAVTAKNYFEVERPFPETYSGQGSWRRVGNGKKHTLFICPSAPAWQTIMEDISEDLTRIGLDGILYDVGAPTPYFCYDKSHTHAKPNLVNACLADNYRRFRSKIRAINPEATVLMENALDICGMYMDLAHGIGSSYPHPGAFVEMYRYTFPEHPLTNRECGFDEDNYLFHAHYSFLYSLRYDMSIYRCRGSFKDLPNYARLLKNLDDVYSQYGHILLAGRFRDNLGFSINNQEVQAKSYETDREQAVTLWNPTGQIQTYCITTAGQFTSGLSLNGSPLGQSGSLAPQSAGVLLFSKI